MMYGKKKKVFSLFWFILYGSFLFSYGLYKGTILCFLWLSFWLLYTPFFLRQKKVARWLQEKTSIKYYYWPLIIWFLALFYALFTLYYSPFIYQETFITSALSLLLMHQQAYWPLFVCCLAKVLYHFGVDVLVQGEKRVLHYLANTFIVLYLYFFFYWCYADFVVLLTVRT